MKMPMLLISMMMMIVNDDDDDDDHIENMMAFPMDLLQLLPV